MNLEAARVFVRRSFSRPGRTIQEEVIQFPSISDGPLTVRILAFPNKLTGQFNPGEKEMNGSTYTVPPENPNQLPVSLDSEGEIQAGRSDKILLVQREPIILQQE